ncbi:MAG: NUDIX domain-containing protein [Bacilli bacterium]
MKKEKSCGGIVYKYHQNELYILMIEMNPGHWSFPKGHVEGNETEIETAIREIKEETNIDVIIDTKFRMVTTYNPTKEILKDVIYFVATPISDDIKRQVEEISDLKWIYYDDALKVVTYESDKNILEKAIEYIQSKR